MSSLKWFLLAMCFVLAVPAVAQQYTVTDLGTLGGYTSFAQAVGPDGQVAGYSTPSLSGYPHAFLWKEGTMSNLGTFGGFRSYGRGINGMGWVVGSSYFADNSTYHAFLYKDGVMVDLGVLPGGTLSSARGINSSGQVVGTSTTNGPASPRAFVYDGAMTALGTLGGSSSYGYGINELGWVAGYSAGADGISHAFLWKDGVMADLGTLSGRPASFGMGVNSLGHVVGYASTNDFNNLVHAFLWKNGVMVDLGTFGGTESQALGINDQGQVVGTAEIAGDVDFHAFLYSGGTMTDLNDLIPQSSGWILQAATGVNEKGQIVGYGFGPSGSQHAFLLTPAIRRVAYVEQPINIDGTSVFKASRGVIPVKFRLTEDGIPTCSLPPATIEVLRISNGVPGVVDEGVYVQSADLGSSFRIDSSACQYVYNLAARALGPGTYQVDIYIGPSMVGAGKFALK